MSNEGHEGAADSATEAPFLVTPPPARSRATRQRVDASPAAAQQVRTPLSVLRTPTPSRSTRTGTRAASNIPSSARSENHSNRHASPRSSSRSGGRVSPYPARTREPVTGQAIGNSPGGRHDRSAAELTIAGHDQSAGRRPSQRGHLQLVVQPIVKTFINQRDVSGQTLDPTVVTGSTFIEIMRSLWDKYSDQVKGRAVKAGQGWSLVSVSFEEWARVMQFRRKRDVIDSSKSEYAWNQWLVQCRSETIKLVVFEYGTALVKAKELEEFLVACVRPRLSDRAGAAADELLQEVTVKLQRHWSSTFRAEAAVWRMWGNHITRNLDRSTWDRDVERDPPEHVAALLRPADLPSDRQLGQLTRSASVALEGVNAASEDLQDLRDAWKMLGDRLDRVERNLARRKRFVEALLADAALPSLDSVIDPLPLMENIPDTEHED